MIVNVVDSIMGSGKTSAAINYINNSPEDVKIIYITPYIKEIERIINKCQNKKFEQPRKYTEHTPKIVHLKDLLNKGKNIATTHALFHHFDDEVIDFANKEMHERTGETTYHEFGILSPQLNIDRILFADLHTDTRKLICNPLIQFYAFNQYMKLVFDAENVHQPWSHNYPWNKTNDFDKVFRQSNSMSTLNDCLNSFSNWLMELNDKEVHRHRFSPFNLTNQSIAFVLGNSNDIVIKRGKFLYRDWAWFDNELNRQSTKRDTQISESLSKEQRFLELFYRTTKKFVDDLIPNSQDN